MTKTFIFGDIDGRNDIYQSTINCIKRNRYKRSKFVFLGDIYDYNKSDESITMIKNIMNEFSIPIHDDIRETERGVVKDIIHPFRQLRNSHGVNSYQEFRIQYWKNTIPKNDYTHIKKHQNYKFLFGNKEIALIRDIANSPNVRKVVNENGEVVYVINSYYDTKPNDKEARVHVSRTYTLEQLNILYNYLKRCANYYFNEDGILFTHCYFNNIKFGNIKVVVSGHSRGYGKFTDIRYQGLVIYLGDLSGSNGNVNNYITYQNKKFKLYNPTIAPRNVRDLIEEREEEDIVNNGESLMVMNNNDKIVDTLLAHSLSLTLKRSLTPTYPNSNTNSSLLTHSRSHLSLTSAITPFTPSHVA